MKILIIGQAPPIKKQAVPYDTTLLYEMLSWVGITKDQAQETFEFEAVTNEFPGLYKKGYHAKPSNEAMQRHWDNTLRDKVIMARKIILLGKIAAKYFDEKTSIWNYNLKELELPHPSRRNYSRIMKQKTEITKLLSDYIFQ